MRKATRDAIKNAVEQTTTQPTTQNHPEVKTGEEATFTSGMTSEADYSVQSNILNSQIRTQRLHQQTHQLRGEKAKTRRKKLWADTEEVKADTQQVVLEIETDKLEGKKKEKEVNRDSITQTLASKQYKTDNTRHQNNGARQALINSGINPTLDHNSGFSGVTGAK